MDAAALALNVDSSSVLKAANDLDRFSAAADKAGKAANIPVGSIAKLVATVQSMDSKLTAILGSVNKAVAAMTALDRGATGAAAANDNLGRSIGVADSHVVAYREHLQALVSAQTASTAAGQAADAHVLAYTQHLQSLGQAQQQANAHVVAWQAAVQAQSQTQGDANAHVLAYRDSLNRVEESAAAATRGIKFTAVEGLNASRQLADIGVTAASGMSPFLIALQQGPQLFDIIQNKAVMTGATVGAVFRAAAIEVLAFIAPFLPLIAILTLAAAGIAALTKQANDDSGLKKYTTAMGYTKAEVEKLNSVTVTFGDTAKAVFQVGLESIASSFGMTAGDMGKTWDRFLDRLVSGTRAALAGVYAAVAGTRAYLGELEKGGILGIGKMLIGQGDPNLLKNTYGKVYAEGQKGLDAIMNQARKNAQGRQNEMARNFYDAPSRTKTPSAGKSSAEKFADIVREAQADIAAQKARADAADMGAQAAAELEKRTALLNRVQKAGIPVTAAIRTEIDKLATAYADAKVGADTQIAIVGVTDDIEKQRRGIADQTKLIGLYGDALARARREQEAQARLRDALPKGEIVVMPNITKALSDDIEASDRLQRAADLRKASEDSAAAMERERGALGLTGVAALQYAFVTDRLNEARQKGVQLSPDEIAAINAAGQAYASQRYELDQTAQRLADTREIAGGFFSDLMQGARNGGNAFKILADSAVNALNRIIDKLANRALDSFLNNIGGGNSYDASATRNAANSALDAIPRNALGGVYGSPTRFAKGGAFTNTIVNTPTLFRFANGAKMGEMGEAGPEAIMPLKRGPNGALGVQMHGGGRPVIRMGDYNPNFSFAGAVGLDGVAEMVRQGGQATYDQMKRDLQSLLQQLDTDGSFAS